MSDKIKVPGIFETLKVKLAEEPAIYTVAFIIIAILVSSIPLGIIVGGVIKIITALMTAL